MGMTEQQLFERFGKEFSAGFVLFEEGDMGDETYIILSGSIRIIKRLKQGDRTLAVIPADEFVGEMATLLQEPRSATAIVEEDAKLLVVNTQTFEAMIKANSGIALRIIKKLAERIQKSNKQLEILMLKDANSKVVYGLVNSAENGQQLPDGTLIKITDDDLSLLTEVETAKVKEIIQKLMKSKLILPHEDGYIMTSKEKLIKFLEYLTMSEEIGNFSSTALKTIITDQRLNAEQLR